MLLTIRTNVSPIASLASRTFRTENENQDDENYQFSLNYINNLDDDGQKLTADLQYSKGNETKISIIEENRTFPDTDLIVLENVFETEKQNEYLAQADYVLTYGRCTI